MRKDRHGSYLALLWIKLTIRQSLSFSASWQGAEINAALKKAPKFVIVIVWTLCFPDNGWKLTWRQSPCSMRLSRDGGAFVQLVEFDWTSRAPQVVLAARRARLIP
jgi:hypothetical protein